MAEHFRGRVALKGATAGAIRASPAIITGQTGIAALFSLASCFFFLTFDWQSLETQTGIARLFFLWAWIREVKKRDRKALLMIHLTIEFRKMHNFYTKFVCTIQVLFDARCNFILTIETVLLILVRSRAS